MWWERTTLALWTVAALFQLAVLPLSFVDDPKIGLVPQVAVLCLMGFWAVMAVGRRIAFRYAKSRRPDGPEADYVDLPVAG
jgi:hypothetical protein